MKSESLYRVEMHQAKREVHIYVLKIIYFYNKFSKNYFLLKFYQVIFIIKKLFVKLLFVIQNKKPFSLT